MKNTFKFEIHILYYLVGLFCFFIGYFKDFVWISLLIIIHECGHVTGAVVCNWKIQKVIILPFGGMTQLKEHINAFIKEEWLIVLLGPLYQIGFFFLLHFMGYTDARFTFYHYLLLLFNLMPIIPLDGSKMIGLLAETIFAYKKAKYIEFWISIGLLVILILYTISSKNIILGIISLFLIKENWNYYQNIPYQFEKFLLERYLYSFKHLKLCHIKNISQMKRSRNHLFWLNGIWKKEHEILKNYFENGNHYI